MSARCHTRLARASLRAVVALALVTLACERRPAPGGPPPGPEDRAAAASTGDLGAAEAEGTGAYGGGTSAALESTGLGTGQGSGEPTEPEPVEVGEPVPPEDLPAGWPAEIPLPEGADVTLVEVPEGGLASLEAMHDATADDLLDWYVEQLSDRGWLVLERTRLGPSARVRFARGTERWLVVVSRARLRGESRSWISLRRMLDEQPLDSLPVGSGTRCTAALPNTPPPAPARCDLLVGAALEGIPEGAQAADAADDGRETALLYLSGRELNLLTLRDEAVRRGPRRLLELDAVDPADAYPRVVPGADGWLVTWIDGDPSERRAAHYDRDLHRTDRDLRLSREMGVVGEVGLAPTVLRGRYPEYAAAWVEPLDDALAFRIAGVKRDADRVRRSGRFPVGAGALSAGPVLVSDGEAHLALLWGTAGGIFLRPIGTDGLPDGPEHQLEPGEPSWLGAAWAEESYWVAWNHGGHGFWVRTSPEGCLDARGSLRGEPTQLWATPLGTLVQVRRDGRTELVRLADLGGEVPSGAPELLGSTPLEVFWSDFDPAPDGLRGFVRLATGFHPARWECL